MPGDGASARASSGTSRLIRRNANMKAILIFSGLMVKNFVIMCLFIFYTSISSIIVNKIANNRI